jgi:hypothetical protein
MSSAETPNLQKYIWQYVVSYILCSVIVAAITYIIDIEVPSSMGIITLMVSASYPMQTFVRTEQRVMTKGERSRFAAWATAASLALTAVTVFVMCLYYGVSVSDLIEYAEIPFWLMALVGFIAVVLSWVVVYFGSGFMGNQALKQLKKG